MTAELCRRAGVTCAHRPGDGRSAPDARRHPSRAFPFQEWFVGRGHEDEVDAVVFEGADVATPAPGVLEALDAADAILFAPATPTCRSARSSPSRRSRAAMRARKVRSVAVSPLVGGRPSTARSVDALPHGRRHGPAHVAACYDGLVDVLVVDESDAPATAGIELLAANTLCGRRLRAAARRGRSGGACA